MQNKFIPFVLLVLISCSEMSQNDVNPSWQDVGVSFYNEVLECNAGPKYSLESLNQMLSEYRDLVNDENLLGAWGYAPTEENTRVDNGWWELQWTSKMAADAGWASWTSNEDASAWSVKYQEVLQCDAENRSSWMFVMGTDPTAFGDFNQDDPSFATAFIPCNLNDGKTPDDLEAALVKYNEWLDSLDKSVYDSAYTFGLYFPAFETNEIDYWWGNFHQTFEGMQQGNEAWEEPEAMDARSALEEVSTCGNPDLYNSQTIYDPLNPKLS